MQIVFDAENPVPLSRFWAAALGYVEQPPPEGFKDWMAFLSAQGVPEDRWDGAAAIIDPNGQLPRVFFQRVPEPKSAKNRVHLDLNSGGGPTVALDVQHRRVEAAVEKLTKLGATYLMTNEELGVVWAVMIDPEGNEFCA